MRSSRLFCGSKGEGSQSLLRASLSILQRLRASRSPEPEVSRPANFGRLQRGKTSDHCPHGAVMSSRETDMPQDPFRNIRLQERCEVSPALSLSCFLTPAPLVCLPESALLLFLFPTFHVSAPWPLPPPALLTLSGLSGFLPPCLHLLLFACLSAWVSVSLPPSLPLSLFPPLTACRSPLSF